MLTFYTNPMSRGRIVRWMLEELGEPYDTVVLGYGAAMKTPDYLAINAIGKVPALVHDDHVVTEGAAICCYLAQAFPARGLMAQDHAAFYRWLFFAAGPVEAAVTNGAMGWQVPPEHEGRVGYGSLARVVAALDGHFSQNDYVADSRFTAADVYVGAQIGWGMRFGTLPATPALTAYWDRLKDRPAHLAAAAKDDALVPAKDEP